MQPGSPPATGPAGREPFLTCPPGIWQRLWGVAGLGGSQLRVPTNSGADLPGANPEKSRRRRRLQAPPALTRPPRLPSFAFASFFFFPPPSYTHRAFGRGWGAWRAWGARGSEFRQIREPAPAKWLHATKSLRSLTLEPTYPRPTLCKITARDQVPAPTYPRPNLF